MKVELVEHYSAAVALLIYDKTTGEFTWRSRSDIKRTKSWNAKYAGKIAGNVNKVLGYRQITLSTGGVTKLIYAHRLAWFLHHGKIADGEVDHINGVKHDNRIENLRLVSVSKNHRNMKMNSRNTSGHTGVTLDKRRCRWNAVCVIDTKNVYLGSYLSPSQASSVVQLHRTANGFTERHGAIETL